MITLIPTSTAEHIALRMKDNRDFNVIVPDKNKDGKRLFPDGEVYTKISNIDHTAKRVVVIHAGQPNPNAGLVELDMTLQILNNVDVKNIELFFTYIPYGMQDNEFETGEVNAVKALLTKLTSYYHVKKIYTIDAHFHGKLWINEFPLTNISAVDILTRQAAEDFPGIVFSTPDAGSHRRTGIKGTEKKRTDSFTTELFSDDKFHSNVKGRIIGVIDDLLETGGTLDKFYDMCKNCGAKDVVALITHGVLPAGLKRVTNKYQRVYLTNTINRPEANVDITPLIINALE